MVQLCLFLDLGALMNLRPVAAVTMIYDDSLPGNLPSACSAALLADFFYRPTSLERMCTSGCAAALSSWTVSVRSACGEDVSVPAEFELPASRVVSPATLEHTFQFTCPRENNNFRGPVAALAAVFRDPGVSPFNYLSEAPEEAAEPSSCDVCIAARLRMRAGSPYFDGPVVVSESLYQSMTSSCGITGKPVTTTTIDYSTSEPEPTKASCGGTRYAIQSSDDCYSISKAQGVGTAWLLADNNLAAYCADFPTSGSLCITNNGDTVAVGVSQTSVTIADAASITETQLKAWNLVINPVCSNINMMNGTTICISPPGPLLPPPVTTNIPPLIPTTAAPAPTDAATGSNKLLKFAISLDDFLFLNTGINANCTNLYAGESYCSIPTMAGRVMSPSQLIPVLPSPASLFTMLPNATVTSYSRPYRTPLPPLATGVRDDCVHYFKGDDYQFLSDQLGHWKSNCELAARNYNADNDNFVAWNALGTNVTDPTCSFVAGERYCGSWDLKATRTVTETDPTTTTSGDGGPASQVTSNGISLNQFLTWNLAVSSDCVTNFWLGQAYCVGVSGSRTISISSSTALTRTTRTSAVNPTPPEPTHEEQPRNRKKWDLVRPGMAAPRWRKTMASR
ncbi:LysM domain-containing protein [Colletotrichum shisoi]|uniref:LysM domain-containing protein n=1 Tax=Colletotrichum shisoi TaxID=2078593 RepID=A0A5Q4C7J9_9PEZI|nr:LysM domain-containing protein [Colletotrichum shisoi]